jgi:hypothetical protein
MQIKRPCGDIMTVIPFEDRLIEVRLNRKDHNGYYKPQKGRVIRFERELLPSMIEALIHFDNEGSEETNGINREPASKAC